MKAGDTVFYIGLDEDLIPTIRPCTLVKPLGPSEGKRQWWVRGAMRGVEVADIREDNLHPTRAQATAVLIDKCEVRIRLYQQAIAKAKENA